MLESIVEAYSEFLVELGYQMMVKIEEIEGLLVLDTEVCELIDPLVLSNFPTYVYSRVCMNRSWSMRVTQRERKERNEGDTARDSSAQSYTAA